MGIKFLDYFKFVNSYAKKHRYLFVSVLFLSTIVSFVCLINPIISRVLIDKVLINKDQLLIMRMAVYILLAVVVASILNILTSFLKALFSNKLDYAIKLDFFDRLQKSLYLSNTSKYSGEVYYRMFRDGSFLVNYYLKLMLDFNINFILIVVIVYIMLKWSIMLTILSIFMVIMQVILVIIFKKPLMKIVYKQREIEQDLSASVNQNFNENEITKLLNLEYKKYVSMKNKFDSVIKISVKNVFLESVINHISGFSNQLWSTILLILGSALVLNNRISIGTLMGFYMLVNLFYMPALSIVSIIYKYPEAKISFIRFQEYYNNIDPSYNSVIPFKFENNMKLSNICYMYKGSNKLLLEDINMEAHPGEIVLIMGESGIGKSTLIKILSRLLLPTKGSITLDDINVSEINIQDYRKNIGVLTQTPVLLNDTLKNNIVLEDTDINDKEIYKFLKKLGMTKFCNNVGLNTILGVKGKKISQGENQRINLARILIRKPKIIILDEPTSSLDKYAEKLVIEALNEYKLSNNGLIIIVTHSTEFLHIADKVINM